ncbi:SGNH hydrolase [Kitasatospora sp. NE20-6]|uniref:GDSL-type esterase/lipase family protein n=1 Tax=Kitasatospora sp. NE20-6 TaxID=2859066 RepID=UPI0034DC309A
MKKNVLGAVLVLWSLLLALAVAHPAGTASAAAAAPVRIMPLGDSITGSPGCWRALLWNKLQAAGHTNIDFVGTLGPQGCSVSYDGDNEGHGGFLVTNVAAQNQLPAWLAAARPDIVLMHFGTNDVWSNIAPATILAAYSTLLDQMRAANPDTKLLVAKIIPMNPSTCAECAQRAEALDAAIPGWAAEHSTTRSPVVLVDQWTGFSTATDTYDGVHPNASGDVKMADRWYPALAGLLAGGTSSPSPSPSSSTSPSPSPSPSSSPTPSPTVPMGGCTATFKPVGSWQGGGQGEVTVRNNGSAPIAGWTVGVAYGGGEKITQLWSGTLAADGTTVRNAAWNGTLAAGATTAFGYLVSAASTPGTPALTCTPA